MAEQAKNILIGLLIIAAIAVLIFAFFFIHPFMGDRAKVLKVRFTDIDKINVGTRVNFAGKAVGEVVEIRELHDIREQRRDRKGDVYAYELILEVDSGVTVYKTDEISIRSSGLLGERSIAITPKPFVPGQPPILITDQVIYAEPVGSVEDTLEEFSKLSGKIDQLLEEILNAVSQLNQQDIWTKLTKTVENISEITTALNKKEAWEGIVTNLHKLSERLPKSWDIVDESLENLLIASVNVRSISETGQIVLNSSKEMVDRVALGQGNLGRLLVGSDLYLQMKALLSQGGTLLDDVSNYGILFHLNKRWQRLHARRLNLMNKLANPNEFSRFFNCELNAISSSLSRVGMLLREEESLPCPLRLLCNPEYTHAFSELLQRVEAIEESLSMYNEQMIDCAEQGCCP